MVSSTFSLGHGLVEGHEIPIGPVSLVFAKANKGLVGCGAVDVIALEKFSLPAAKVKPVSSDSIRNIDDLLQGEIVVVNRFAQELGVTAGMTGKQALALLG